jgi:hypothetical protein
MTQGYMKNAYTILIGETPLARRINKWTLQKIRCKNVLWIQLAYDKLLWKVSVNTTMNRPSSTTVKAFISLNTSLWCRHENRFCQ